MAKINNIMEMFTEESAPFVFNADAPVGIMIVGHDNREPKKASTSRCFLPNNLGCGRGFLCTYGNRLGAMIHGASTMQSPIYMRVRTCLEGYTTIRRK